MTSTLSDIYSAVTAAIGTLKGPLHGGANEAVMHDMLEIGDRATRRRWVRGKLASKEKIMGFGHRVYKNGDSRVPTMKAALPRCGRRDGRRAVAARCTRSWRATMVAATGIKPNLDFPTGPAYYLMGFDVAMLHADLRDEPDHRLDRAHHRAGGIERADPAAQRLFGPTTAGDCLTPGGNAGPGSDDALLACAYFAGRGDHVPQ